MSSSSRVFRRNARRRTDEALSHARRSLRDPRALHAFDDLALAARRRSWLTFRPHVRRHRHLGVEVLTHLARHAHAFANPPTSWSTETTSPWVFASSLANHLFGRHDVPVFLSKVWYGAAVEDAEADRARRWFVDFAAGRRLRDLDLPIILTRRMEHAFLHSPGHLSVYAALRRAQLIALGADAPLVANVLRTPLRSPQADEAFWLNVIHFLVREQERVDDRSVSRIVEYIDHVRHGCTTTLEGRDAPALRPDYSLKGRTLASLLRDIDAWDATVGRSGGMDWRPSRYRPMDIVDTDESSPRWIITELRTDADLYEEGRRMHHCVHDYTNICRSGRSQIWSLRRLNGDGTWRPLVTFEVYPFDNSIFTISAPCNRQPSPELMSIITRWAEREGITMDC